MTKQETAMVMAVLKVAYPGYYRGVDADEARAAVKLWAQMFAEDDASVVTAAVKAYIAADAKGFPPSIGQVREKMRLLTEPQGLGEAEAWALVRKAVSNAGYHAEEEFAALPEEIQRAVGSPGMLRTWAMTDLDELATVVQSNFMRSYRAKARADAEYKSLPADVRNLLESAGAGVARLEAAR